MPLFNGTNIFGYNVKIRTVVGEIRRQENDFPGLNGTESLTLGTAGCTTMAEGLLAGNGSAGLQSAEFLFRTYYDGNAYALVDSYGTTWNNVILKVFEPQGRIFQSPSGFYFRTYSAVFDHLTVS
jgi:hypothetical protein